MAAAALFTPSTLVGDKPTGVGPTGFNASPAVAAALTPAQKAMQLLQGTPDYLAATTAANQAQEQGASARAAAIQQAAMQSGFVPTGFNDQYGDLSPAILAAAKANPYSDYAQALKSEQVTHDSDMGSLGGSGMWSSGAAPITANNENYQNNLDLYNIGQSFGSAAGTALGNYANVLGTNAQNLSQAVQNAQASAATSPEYTSALPVAKAPTVPGTQATAPSPTRSISIPQHVSGSFAMPTNQVMPHFAGKL